MLWIGCVLSGGPYLQTFTMWRHNDVIGRNEYLISTLSESAIPQVYSLQFLFKSAHSWRYKRKCEWVFFSEHSVFSVRAATAIVEKF